MQREELVWYPREDSYTKNIFRYTDDLAGFNHSNSTWRATFGLRSQTRIMEIQGTQNSIQGSPVLGMFETYSSTRRKKGEALFTPDHKLACLNDWRGKSGEGISNFDDFPQQPLQTSEHVLGKPPIPVCVCAKSNCSKQHCECLGKRKVCDEKCRCLGCLSKHEKQRNKEKKRATALGCNCRKSSCLKMYCACRLNGKQCGPSCQCEDCSNKPEEVIKNVSPKSSVVTKEAPATGETDLLMCYSDLRDDPTRSKNLLKRYKPPEGTLRVKMLHLPLYL